MHHPLAPRLSVSGWRWISVEEALGFGPVRTWVAEWADSRGGLLIATRHNAGLLKVAQRDAGGVRRFLVLIVIRGVCKG